MFTLLVLFDQQSNTRYTVIYWSLYNTGLENNIHRYLCKNIHKHVVEWWWWGRHLHIKSKKKSGETLPIDLYCVRAPGIDDLNTESDSPRPAVVLSSAGCNTLNPRQVSVGSAGSGFTLFGWPDSHFPFPVTRHEHGRSLNPSWVSMTQTLFLPGAVRLVSRRRLKDADGRDVWESAARNPKHLLALTMQNV